MGDKFTPKDKKKKRCPSGSVLAYHFERKSAGVAAAPHRAVASMGAERRRLVCPEEESIWIDLGSPCFLSV
jgi:hypothetical protein